MADNYFDYSSFVIDKENFSFTRTYKDFIEFTAFKDIRNFNNILFYGWINEFYLAIEDYNRRLKFVFGNIREDKRIYYIPVYKNESGYKCFKLKYIEKFPKDWLKEFKKRGLVFNKRYMSNQYTTVQRLICCCMYNIQDSHVHHLDFNINNNHISNIIPIYPTEHEEYHLCSNAKTLSYINKASNYFLEIKRDYQSKYKDDIKIYIVLYYRYILGYKIGIISKFKGIKPLSIATIKRILKSFRDFNLFYSVIKGKNTNVDTF
jgi:hypothetical protein